MRIAKIILTLVYALYIVWGIYFFSRSAVLLLMAVVPNIITILALSGKFGNWARISALLFAVLVLLSAISMSASGIWQFFNGASDQLWALYLAGPIFAVVSGITIWVLKNPVVRLDNAANQ